MCVRGNIVQHSDDSKSLWYYKPDTNIGLNIDFTLVK